ncbi:MAG TPA: BamA/TamA family outer membrane protein [Myxococcales bacterium]|nr:BamA/TamA family outer membrane protein [Myxococcales bacterium]
MRLIALALLLAALPAAAIEPRYVWETLDTPHFEVHYHQGMYRYAQKLARMAEEVHSRIVPLLDHEPWTRTQLVVQDDTDFANGNATPLVYPEIHVFAAPPDSRSTLGDFDDNLYELIGHEYTHIVHLDTALGLPGAVNDIFGHLWITNGEQPLWFIEGMATFTESEVSASGRVRSSEEDMLVRAEVLDGKLPALDTLSNVPLAWPRGFGQYTVGSRFLEWIRDQYGLGALRDLSHDFGARPIPFGMNISADRVLGSTYIDLYKQFGQAELDHALALQTQVRLTGETPIEGLTKLGEWVRTPRFSKDGKTLYYTWSGPDRLAEVRALPLTPCCDANAQMPKAVRAGDERIATLWSDGAGDDGVSVAPDGRVVYAREQVFQEYEDLQDLYSVDPNKGGEERLSRGLRARNPDVGPDGAMTFLWRKPGGGTAIGILDKGSNEPRAVFADPQREPVDSPRFSPDGKRIAFLRHRFGAWDVQVINRDGTGLVDVTKDRALDRDPAWTSDGKWLLFSSDRTKIYNIYAWNAADGSVWQVTNAGLGAFEPEPSPDLKQLALVTYSSRGYDVGRMPFEPASWRKVTETVFAADDRPAVTPLPPEENYPSRPYNPLPTLRPHFWLPYAATDAYGTTFGALTQGFDAVDRHELAATVWYSLYGHEPGFDLLYTNRTLYPALSVEASRDLVTTAAAGQLGTGYYIERETGVTFSAQFPFSQAESGQSLTLQYQLFNFSVDQNPFGVGLSPGRLAALRLVYAYSDAFRFVNSVSAERGQRFSLALRLADPAVGGDYSFWQLQGRASKYFLLPWTHENGLPLHHALGIQLSGGLARGDLSNRHEFFLGGFQQGNLVNAVLSPAAAPANILRGFREDSFEGESYVLGTAEYRFPIFSPEIGAWTLPAYLRRIHGALFTDVGDAFTAHLRDFKLHAGAGAELRAEVVLGFILPTDVRLGCARGLENSPAAIVDCYAALGGEF